MHAPEPENEDFTAAGPQHIEIEVGSPAKVMEIDQDSQLGFAPKYTLPNYGTKRYSEIFSPTMASPTTLEELFEEYKTFSLLKKKDDMASSLEPGVESFIISRPWLKKYSKFILYDQFKADTTENDLKIGEDHFSANMPGPIMNERDCCESDQKGENLYGTGTVKGFESEYIDMYIDQNKSVQSDFMCINEELWKFLFERYGG